MADNNSDINSISINHMDKPLPPQPQRIRHLPEWETPLHPPKRRRDESSSIFSRLPSLTIPKPAISIAMPPALKRPTTFTTRPNNPKKKKATPINKQSISAPFAFSPGASSPVGSMSMLNKEMLLASPTGSGTLLPIHHIPNARSSHTLNTTTTLTTGWSPPSTPLQYPHNHNQPIDEKLTTPPKSPLSSRLSILKSTHLPALKLHLTTSLNTLLSKKEPPSPSPTNIPPEKLPPRKKFPHNLNPTTIPRRTLLLYILLPISLLLLLALILGLSLGLTLPHKPSSNPTTLPLPWNPPPVEGYPSSLTYYNITGPGACGYNNTDAEYVCAVGHEVFDAAGGGATNPNENVLCGRKIRVWREGGREWDGVVVMVVDRCGGCEGADLDLSVGVFEGFDGIGGGAALQEGRVRGRWVWL